MRRGKGKTDGGGERGGKRKGKKWNEEDAMTEIREMEERKRGQGGRGGGGADNVKERGGIEEKRELKGGGRGGLEGGGGGGGGQKGKKECAEAGEWKDAKTTGGGEGRGGADAAERKTDGGVAERGGKGGDRAEKIEGGSGNGGERAEEGGGGGNKGKGAERGEGGGKERKKSKEGVQTAREGSGTGADKKGTAGNGEGRFSPGNTAAAEANKAAKSRQIAEKQKSHGKICHREAQRGRDNRTQGTATPAPEEGTEKGNKGIICGESEGEVIKEETNDRREESGSRRRQQEAEEGQGETECIEGAVGEKATGGIGGAGKGVEEDRNESKKRRRGEETENKGDRGGRIGMCGGSRMGRGGGEVLGEGGGGGAGGRGRTVNERDSGLKVEQVNDGGGEKGKGKKTGGQMKGSGREMGRESAGRENRGDITVKSEGNGVSGAVAEREGGTRVHGGAAGQRAQGAEPERNAFPPGDVQDSAACLAGGAMDHRVPTPAEPRKTLQTTTQTESQSWSVQGKKLTRSGSTRCHSAHGKRQNTWTAKIPLLHLFFVGLIGQLACVGAGPVSVNLHVEGRGRTLQGENYSLVCKVTPPLAAHTGPAFSWYRNGTLNDSQTGQVLNFYPLSKQDEGDYQCGLKSENVDRDQLSDPFTLHVLVLENISLVPEVEVEEGQTVILNCSVHSDPTAFLTWRVGAKTERSLWSNSDSLVIPNAWLYHRVIVQCRAYNNGLTLTFLDAFSLIRRKGTYEVMPKPQLGQKGVPVLHRPFGMECVVEKLPNQGVNVHLTYTWYKDDKVIEGQSDMILDFPSLRKEDNGLYTCTARNGKPRTTSPQSNALEVVMLIPPVVHIEPRPPDNVITQAAGETLTLTCKVTEAFTVVAPDGYRWSYLPSPGGQLRPLEGRENTLTLGPLTREDSGQYICQAWNYEDFDGLLPPGNASVIVDVMYLGHITLTSDLKVSEGDPVILTCSVDCNPAARLSWLVEGREVRHVTANMDHYMQERAACSDNKTYTCRASNPHLPDLEVQASTYVTVNCIQSRHGKMPDLDIFVVQGNPTAVKGQSHSLRCLSSATPDREAGRTYVWIKDNRTMELENGEHLTFSSVTEENHGVYQCGRKHAHSLLLSQPFELHVLEEQTPGFVQIGVPIIVLAVTVAAAAVITVVLCKKKKKQKKKIFQENAMKVNGAEESTTLVTPSAPPDSRQEPHDSVQPSPTPDSGEVQPMIEETSL